MTSMKEGHVTPVSSNNLEVIPYPSWHCLSGHFHQVVEELVIDLGTAKEDLHCYREG